jgi:ABC-type thiamin/hydroxymethylpyrimidine transport system permease subunit
MKKMVSGRNKFLMKFSVLDLMLIAMTASLGIAVKPVIVPLTHIITGPLYLPGGVIAGGFYMMWLVIGAGLVKKTGTATLVAIVQAIMVVSLGIFGTHGLVSLFTYIAPGLAVDIVLWLTRHKGCCGSCCFLAGIAANISGTYVVNIVFFQLPLIPLLLSLSAATLSGGVGGLIAYGIIKQFRNYSFLDFKV